LKCKKCEKCSKAGKVKNYVWNKNQIIFLKYSKAPEMWKMFWNMKNVPKCDKCSEIGKRENHISDIWKYFKGPKMKFVQMSETAYFGRKRRLWLKCWWTNRRKNNPRFLMGYWGDGYVSNRDMIRIKHHWPFSQWIVFRSY